MSLPRDIVPAGHVENAADPPSRPVAQACQPPQPHMDGTQRVQWLSVQAGNVAGDLQHNARVLMLRASSPMPISDGHDEVASLRKSGSRSSRSADYAKKQALAIETFQSKWQVAGLEAHAFIAKAAKTRSQPEDFVRAELMAV